MKVKLNNYYYITTILLCVNKGALARLRIVTYELSTYKSYTLNKYVQAGFGNNWLQRLMCRKIQLTKQAGILKYKHIT